MPLTDIFFKTLYLSYSYKKKKNRMMFFSDLIYHHTYHHTSKTHEKKLHVRTCWIFGECRTFYIYVNYIYVNYILFTFQFRKIIQLTSAKTQKCIFNWGLARKDTVPLFQVSLKDILQEDHNSLVRFASVVDHS